MASSLSMMSHLVCQTSPGFKQDSQPSSARSLSLTLAYITIPFVEIPRDTPCCSDCFHAGHGPRCSFEGPKRSCYYRAHNQTGFPSDSKPTLCRVWLVPITPIPKAASATTSITSALINLLPGTLTFLLYL